MIRYTTLARMHLTSTERLVIYDFTRGGAHLGTEWKEVKPKPALEENVMSYQRWACEEDTTLLCDYDVLIGHSRYVGTTYYVT